MGIVTGGARGLGLVMSQALVISGADVAIVDLNSRYYHHIGLVRNAKIFVRGRGRTSSQAPDAALSG